MVFNLTLVPAEVSAGHWAPLPFPCPTQPPLCGFSIIVRVFFCLSLKYQFQAPLLTWVSTLPIKSLPPHPLPKALSFFHSDLWFGKTILFWDITSFSYPSYPLKKNATKQKKLIPCADTYPRHAKHFPLSFPSQISQINDRHSQLPVPSHTLFHCLQSHFQSHLLLKAHS